MEVLTLYSNATKKYSAFFASGGEVGSCAAADGAGVAVVGVVVDVDVSDGCD